MFEINGVTFLNEGEQAEAYKARNQFNKQFNDIKNFEKEKRYDGLPVGIKSSTPHNKKFMSDIQKMYDTRLSGDKKTADDMEKKLNQKMDKDKDIVNKAKEMSAKYRGTSKEDIAYDAAARHYRRHKNESAIFESVSFLND